MKTTLPKLLSVAAVALAISNTGAQAGKVYLGVGASDVTNANPAGVQTRLKIDNTNWDAMLGNGDQPVRTGSFLQADLGSNSNLSGTTYRYNVVNLVGQGLTFTLDRTPLTPRVDFSLAYGTFTSGIVVTPTRSVSAATLLGAGNVQIAPQTSPYNAIHLFSQATATGSTVRFENVTFGVTDPTIELVGSLPTSGLADNATPFVDSYLAYFNDNGTKGDLSTVA